MIVYICKYFESMWYKLINVNGIDFSVGFNKI